MACFGRCHGYRNEGQKLQVRVQRRPSSIQARPCVQCQGVADWRLSDMRNATAL